VTDLLSDAQRVETHDHAQGRRSLALDLLRALAVFLVLGRHIPLGETNPAVRAFLEVWKRGGWIGVDLFFVLSGFLVSGLLFKTHLRAGRLDVKRFFIRRAFRIYPPFLFLIVVTLAIRFLDGVPSPFSAVISEFLFVQNYFEGLWLHTWSLAVEEHFYLILPLVLLVLSRGRRLADDPFSSLPLIFLTLAAGTLGMRVASSYAQPFSFRTALFPSHLRLDSLFFGVLLSYFYHYNRFDLRRLSNRFSPVLAAAGVLLLAAPFIYEMEATRWLTTYGLTLLYLGSGCLLLSILKIDARRHGFVLRTVGLIGSHSYSIYLWHPAVLDWGLRFVRKILGEHFNYPVMLLTYFVGSIVLGITLSLLFEDPLLKLRNRLFPSEAGNPLTKTDTTRARASV
jgi:peptidoglycan/LPS O-acetylase OafA/YrhL